MHLLADLLLRAPRLVVGLLVVLSAGAAAFLLTHGVRFDYDLEGFLPAGDPTIQEYRAFTARYEPDDVLIAVGFEVGDIFQPRVLHALEAMTEALSALAGVEEVVSLASAEHLESGEAGLEAVPLVGAIPEDAEGLAALEARVRRDSLAVGYVLSEAGDAAALFLRIDPALNSYEQRGAIIEEAQAALAPWAGRYDFRWSGYPYLRNAYVRLLQMEVVRSVALASLVIVLVLLWMFRSTRGTVIPMVVVWLGVLWTVAAMMLAGSAIDVLASSLAAIILVVAVADSIHFLAKYYDGLAAGLEQRVALREMVVRLGAATFMTSLTTAVGFGTLATSRVVPMQRFGVFTAIGVMLTFGISLALVAGLLARMRPPRPRQVERLGGGFYRLLDGLDRFTARHPRAIVAASLAVVALGALGATQLRVNARVNDDLGPRTQAYQDARFFEERIVSPFRFEVVLTAPEADAFQEPALLAAVERAARYIERQPPIDRVVSPVDLLKQLQRALHEGADEAYVLPSDPELIAQYFFLLELTDEALLRRFVDFDYGEVRISAQIDDIGSAAFNVFRRDVEAFLAEALPPEVAVTTTGTVVLSADLSAYLVESLFKSMALAFVFIAFLMGLLFRSPKLVLISLIPNVVPLVLIAGLMGALGIEIKPATAVIFSVAFGIAVDDTIHMLARLRQELLAGRPLRLALRETILGTGKAVILTSVILFAGFGVLVTSSFQSTMYMGLLISVTVVLALLADLLLLPALLHLLEPDVAEAGAFSPPLREGADRAAA